MRKFREGARVGAETRDSADYINALTAAVSLPPREKLMPISMYRLTVPVFQRGLETLKTYLDKAEAFAKEKGIDSADLVAARLSSDMLPLSLIHI